MTRQRYEGYIKSLEDNHESSHELISWTFFYVEDGRLSLLLGFRRLSVAAVEVAVAGGGGTSARGQGGASQTTPARSAAGLPPGPACQVHGPSCRLILSEAAVIMLLLLRELLL